MANNFPISTGPKTFTVAGIDCGAETIKVVLWSSRAGDFYFGPIVKYSGDSVASVSAKALASAKQTSGISDKLNLVVATGSMASKMQLANSQAPESECLARGIYHLCPSANTVIDAGAAKVLVVKQERGVPIAMRHSDRCAGGAGAYLETAAEVLGIPVTELGVIALRSTEAVSVQSVCAVFAESEIISLIHAGKKTEDIANGVALSCANRMFPLLNSVGWKREVAFVGGPSKNMSLVKAISNLLNTNLIVPDKSEYCVALGAVLAAREELTNA